MDPFNLNRFNLPRYFKDHFIEQIAEFNVQCYVAYIQSFESLLILKASVRKYKTAIRMAKSNGLNEFRSKVYCAAIQSKEDFANLIIHCDTFDNQTNEVIHAFDDIIDKNAVELNKDPEEGFKWWPTQTQIAIGIILPAAAGLLTYFCYGVGGIVVCSVTGGVAIVGVAAYIVYKLLNKKRYTIKKIGEKIVKHLQKSNEAKRYGDVNDQCEIPEEDEATNDGDIRSQQEMSNLNVSDHCYNNDQEPNLRN